MIFDFLAYLERIDVGIPYEVKYLTGGIVNETARAIKITQSSNGLFAAYHSIILKYAPPYIAGVGTEAKFDQIRQTVEARALSLLPDVFSRPIPFDLPNLLHHDPGSHVLIMTDLGAMPSLSDLFRELGDHTATDSRQQTSTSTLSISEYMPPHFDKIGSTIGQFFATLHSPKSRDMVLNDSTRGSDFLVNPSLSQELFGHTILPIRTKFAQLSDLISDPDADELYRRIEEDFLRVKSAAELSLVLGDAWPGAILVECGSASLDPRIGVIDWEFASIGKGMHGDVAQFLAHLELFQIAAGHRSLDEHIANLNSLMDALVKSYRHHSASKDPKWLADERPVAGSLRCTILRSCLISHAIELVNCAYWKVWVCNDSACHTSDGIHTSDPSACLLIKKMVHRALWYLRIVGEDDADFVAENNWKLIKDIYARKAGMQILDLL